MRKLKLFREETGKPITLAHVLAIVMTLAEIKNTYTGGIKESALSLETVLSNSKKIICCIQTMANHSYVNRGDFFDCTSSIISFCRAFPKLLEAIEPVTKYLESVYSEEHTSDMGEFIRDSFFYRIMFEKPLDSFDLYESVAVTSEIYDRIMEGKPEMFDVDADSVVSNSLEEEGRSFIVDEKKRFIEFLSKTVDLSLQQVIDETSSNPEDDRDFVVLIINGVIRDPEISKHWFTDDFVLRMLERGCEASSVPRR